MALTIENEIADSVTGLEWTGYFYSGYISPQQNAILVTVTQKSAQGVLVGGEIEPQFCPVGEQLNIASSSGSAITDVKVICAVTGQSAVINGYFAAADDPTISASQAADQGTPSTTPILNINQSFTGPAIYNLTPTAPIVLPPGSGGFWLGSSGNLTGIDVQVTTQPGNLNFAQVQSQEYYGFPNGFAGVYAVPAVGENVFLELLVAATAVIHLAMAPIIGWPPPQLDPNSSAVLQAYATQTLSGSGTDIWQLPPYDGDCTMFFQNLGANTMTFGARSMNYQSVQVAVTYYNIVAGNANAFVVPTLKLTHRSNQVFVVGTAGQQYNLSVIQTPRRGGS